MLLYKKWTQYYQIYLTQSRSQVYRVLLRKFFLNSKWTSLIPLYLVLVFNRLCIYFSFPSISSFNLAICSRLVSNSSLNFYSRASKLLISVSIFLILSCMAVLSVYHTPSLPCSPLSIFIYLSLLVILVFLYSISLLSLSSSRAYSCISFLYFSAISIKCAVGDTPS